MHEIIVKINKLFNCSAMPPKPRTAVYKDSETTELALRAHFWANA